MFALKEVLTSIYCEFDIIMFCIGLSDKNFIFLLTGIFGKPFGVHLSIKSQVDKGLELTKYCKARHPRVVESGYLLLLSSFPSHSHLLGTVAQQ
jgi:hypothetical protein